MVVWCSTTQRKDWGGSYWERWQDTRVVNWEESGTTTDLWKLESRVLCERTVLQKQGLPKTWRLRCCTKYSFFPFTQLYVLMWCVCDVLAHHSLLLFCPLFFQFRKWKEKRWAGASGCPPNNLLSEVTDLFSLINGPALGRREGLMYCCFVMEEGMSCFLV